MGDTVIRHTPYRGPTRIWSIGSPKPSPSTRTRVCDVCGAFLRSTNPLDRCSPCCLERGDPPRRVTVLPISAQPRGHLPDCDCLERRRAVHTGAKRIRWVIEVTCPDCLEQRWVSLDGHAKPCRTGYLRRCRMCARQVRFESGAA